MDAEATRAEFRRFEASFSDTIKQLRTELKSDITDIKAEVKAEFFEIRRKQSERDVQLATEAEKARALMDKVEGLDEKVDNTNKCSNCKNEARLERMETYQKILWKIAVAMAATTFGLVMKAAIDFLAKH